MTPPQPTTLPPTELLDRLGTHLTRHIGRGVEYADIRTYVPGDQLRTVNWPVSARRGRLHVTQRLTDRSADVVVLIDGYPQPAGPATEATERIVRGAAQVVQTALRNGDRAGIVALGGRSPRWLGADIGQRQFYRVLDAVLSAGDEFESTTGTLAPRAAVPAGAIVVGFSTLLDTEFALALIDLRRRGHLVVAVDVLAGRAVPLRPRPTGRQDVGAAAVGDVPRHEHRRRRRGGVAARSDPRSVDACGARPSPAIGGTLVMRNATHLLSTVCGLLMVVAAGIGTHGPARAIAWAAVVAVAVAVLLRPLATLAVLLTVVVIAATGPTAMVAAVAGLSAAVYLMLRHAPRVGSAWIR